MRRRNNDPLRKTIRARPIQRKRPRRRPRGVAWKWWDRRYLISRYFEEGFRIGQDNESFYSATLERIAFLQAERFLKMLQLGALIIDGFCGIGVNAIQLALCGFQVIAIDNDPIKVARTKWNAKLYSVDDKIECIVGDFRQLSSSLKGDGVIICPPWGGELNYKDESVYDIEKHMPLNGIEIFRKAKEISSNIAFYLPRNINAAQLRQLAGNHPMDFQVNCSEGDIKAVTAYYGDLVEKT